MTPPGMRQRSRQAALQVLYAVDVAGGDPGPGAEEAFELARLGVRGYLAKPFTLGELRDIVEQAVNAAPQLESVAQQEVGHTPILTVQDRVKKAMLLQALELWDGNYVKTASSLGVTRQAVQQMVKRYEIER